MDRTNDRRDDNTGRDGGPVYVGRFGDAELTDDERATVQEAFAALVRSGRPLFGPVPEEGADALIDPADPGLNTRVRAILHRDVGPRLLDPEDPEEAEAEGTGHPTGRA